MSRWSWAVTAAVLVVWGTCGAFCPPDARADGVVRDGLGAISTGRGGTNLGFADNAAILIDNPAGMVNLAGTRYSEFSADLLWCDLHYTDPDNNTRNRFKTHALPHIGFIRRSEDGLWAVGLGAFAPAGFGAKWDLAEPAPYTGVSEYRSLGALAKLVPAVAVRATDRLSLGATLGVGVSYVELSGPFFLQTGLIQGAPARLGLHATGAQLVWSVGMQYQLTDRTMLGATYTGETRTKLTGDASADVFGVGASDFDAEVHLTWPRSLGVGVKHDFCEHRTLGLDVIWYNWQHAFDDVGLVLSNPSAPAFGPLAPVTDQFPLRWRDSVSVRAGYEFTVRQSDKVRLGYTYHRNPIPEGTLTPYIPAILEHAFSVGYGTGWRDYRIDLAYHYSFGTPRHVGTSDLLGGDFSNSRVEAEAHWALITLSRLF